MRSATTLKHHHPPLTARHGTAACATAVLSSTGMLPLMTLVWGDTAWIVPAIIVAIVGSLMALFVNRRRLATLGLATFCRVLGWALICACLVNPLWSSARPRRGANVLAVVVDISRSHQVATDGAETRAGIFGQSLERGELSESSGWINRIDQDFELQRYTVSDRLERVDSFVGQAFDRPVSNLCSALQQLQQRFEGQPLAGVVLLSDGNATDNFATLDALKTLAPVYPIVVDQATSVPDVAIGAVTVNQTAFDDAPVTLQVQTMQVGASGHNVRLNLLDAQGTPLESKTKVADDDSIVRFEVRPETGGTVFYQVKVDLLDEYGQRDTQEATLVNNRRLVAVDRGGEQRRVLYVSGRPNWEFKFLRRAVETDPQTELVGLIRIAKKEAKFDFRGREGESSNSLFRGFDETEQELAEEFDEPVLVRLGTRDETELQGGFPEEREELFAYAAIILDDVESAFFVADQLQLIYEFVSKRGGGLLMTGGQESFRQGEYDRTPVGELLPIDLHQEVPGPNGPVSLSITENGWLQPWVRLRSDEDAERRRLLEMPRFVTLNPAGFVRPGAVVMLEVEDSGGHKFPALVTQRFGRGRSAALCIGDLWRWRMNEGRRRLQDFSVDTIRLGSAPIAPGEPPEEDLNDHARACRQMIRWLVGDVPRRLDVSVQAEPVLGLGTVRLVADVKGKDFEVREDADVQFTVTKPDGTSITTTGEPSEDVSGRFEAAISAIDSGPWTAAVEVTLADADSEAEQLTSSIGWASQPEQEEMASVRTNTRYLNEITAATGGRLVQIDEVDSFVDSLRQTDAPLVEVWSWPIWNQWWIFGVAVSCFVTDWTIRRRNGLP